MIRRPFTRDELARLAFLAVRIRDEIDRELGELLLSMSGGDDGALAAIHDRLNVLGRFEGADRVRHLVNGE